MSRRKIGKNILPALSAGILNGLLGTGGGIPLWFAVTAQKEHRSAFATSSAGVLILSLVSAFLYRDSSFGFIGKHSLILWAALLGGALGAWLLGRVPLKFMRILFSFLLIGSGAFSLLRTVYDVFFA